MKYRRVRRNYGMGRGTWSGEAFIFVSGLVFSIESVLVPCSVFCVNSVSFPLCG
jgi:hypothetical protein